MRGMTIPMAAMLMAVLAGCATGSGREPPPVNVNTRTLPAAASAAAEAETPLGRALTDAVNRWRAERGAAALRTDATLQRAAAVHAADMAQRDYFGHHNPDGQGPRERVLAVDPDFSASLSENIHRLDGASCNRRRRPAAVSALRGPAHGSSPCRSMPATEAAPDSIAGNDPQMTCSPHRIP